MTSLPDTERASLERGHCPDCDKRGFVLGPQGGNSINIECASLACRARFNVALYAGKVMFAQRLPKRAEGGLAWPSEPMS